MTTKEQNHRLFSGIDIGGTTTGVGLLDATGKLIQYQTLMTVPQDGIESLISRIADILKPKLKNLHARLCGIGVGIAGLVDAQSGVLHYAANLPGWENSPVAQQFQQRFSVPVCLENDANAAALGEYAYGAGKHSVHMLMITLGTGVGGGLILNGCIHRGLNGLAGEIGHNCIDKNGPLCSCGRRGCLESFIGNAPLLRRYTELCNEKNSQNPAVHTVTTTRDISDAAEHGDQAAMQVYSELGSHLALGLSHALNLLDLDRVVLGGGVSGAADFFLETANSVLNGLLLERCKKPQVVPAKLGEYAGMMGAAHSVIQKINSI